MFINVYNLFFLLNFIMKPYYSKMNEEENCLKNDLVLSYMNKIDCLKSNPSNHQISVVTYNDYKFIKKKLIT